MAATRYPKFDYKEYPKTLDPDDVWGQVRRTVNGKPVSEDQIVQIVTAIKRGLRLARPDIVLDLGCGNGALSRYLFGDCAAFHGTDSSEYLISVANKKYASGPDFAFQCADVAEFVKTALQPERFTKALCYGSFSYFSESDAATMLRELHDRFANIERVFIGNLPDRNRADAFYASGIDYSAELDRNESQIGIWRTPREMIELAADHGWIAEISVMPESFYASHYRYDAIIRRAPRRRHSGQRKIEINDLAACGGTPLFDEVRSTSNLVRPDFEKFMAYSRIFFNQTRFTNNGPVVQLLEERLAGFHQVPYCISFCSGFWALVATMKCVALPGKTEVVMPSLTYRRLADLAAWVGLTPHFAEVDASTLAITAEHAAACIRPQTALLIGVHPIVNTCDVDGLVRLSQSSGIPLIFDSVESVYETYHGRKIGGFGRAECFSMHASKLVNGFEGGYVTTYDAELAGRLRLVRGFGFSGQDHVATLGMNAKLNEIHAAMALAGLDDMGDQVDRNRTRYRAYQKGIATIPGVRLLEFDECESNSFKTIVVELQPSWPLSRAKTLKMLHAENVLARPYYAPALHQKKAHYATVFGALPNTEALVQRFMLLPCGHFLAETDIDEIVGLLKFIHDNALVLDGMTQ